MFRTEHPRPDFYRKDWLNLNGIWQFEFDEKDAGLRGKWYDTEHTFGREIEVPFCYQCGKSGIGIEKLIDVMWYRRKFSLPGSFGDKKILLRFGAVDYETGVYVNGQYIGCHTGGYTPFAFDITDALKDGENDLCLRVADRPDRQQPRGKQYWKEGWKRCWYTPVSGIWQTVYLEAVDPSYLERIHITPDIDEGTAEFSLTLNEVPADDTEALITITRENEPERRVRVKLNGINTRILVDMTDPEGIEDVHLWSPADPALYDVSVQLVGNGFPGDCVKTYFGMRKIEEKDGYIMLNNRPLYLRMVLDQGYWPDTLLTPPSEEAIRNDVELTLKMGFNGARKHQKPEDPLYYYWADRLGLLVWGELPAAFEFSERAVMNTSETLYGMIERDYNHPSIIAWVPVNESWGMTRIYANQSMQQTALMLYHQCKALDSTRPVSTNDGWETVECDIFGLHDYTAEGERLSGHFADEDRLVHYAVDGRMNCASGFIPGKIPLMVTEFGGISISGVGEGWGYNGKVKDEEEFLNRLGDQIEGIHRIKDCRGYCYTQLTDVRQEVNGLLTPDREPKVNIDRVRELNVNPPMEKRNY